MKIYTTGAILIFAMWMHVGSALGQEAGSIRAIILSAPNASGWYNVSPTVVLVCAQDIMCPSPPVIRQEGPDQPIVVNGPAGGAAQTLGHVSLDMTPPTVTLVPAPDVTTTNSSVIVWARLVDTMSGIAHAWCNGSAAPVAQSLVACQVQLKDGFNDILISATDSAGNSASAGAVIERRGAVRTVNIVPGFATLAVGERRSPQVIDNFGKSVKSVGWSSDNPAIARVSQQGEVLGMSAGEATVTATAQSVSALLHVRVMEAPLPVGTTSWTFTPDPQFKVVFVPVVEAMPEGPERFMISTSGDGIAQARAIASEGPARSPQQLWLEWPAIGPQEQLVEWMGDHFGAVLVLVENQETQTSSIVRVGRPYQSRLWRFESPGSLSRDWAMAWDGTLYVVETLSDGFARIVAIDSNTGVAKFRQPIAQGLERTAGPRCAPENRRARPIPSVVGPLTVPDGIDLALQVVIIDDVRSCDAMDTAGHSIRRIQLLRLSADGAMRQVALDEVAIQNSIGSATVTPYRVIPDGRDGLIAPMSIAIPGQRPTSQVVRISESNQRTAYPLPTISNGMVGAEWAYIANGHVLVAFDPVGGTIAWTRLSSHGAFVLKFAAVGGVVVEDGPDIVMYSAQDGTPHVLIPGGGIDAWPADLRE